MTAGPAGASADGGPADAPAPKSLLDRVFRTSLILVPVGVLANVWWSWYATDHSRFRQHRLAPRKYLYLALVLALVPWFTNALRLLIWIRWRGASAPRDALNVADARRRAAHQGPDAEIRSRRTIVP